MQGPANWQYPTISPLTAPSPTYERLTSGSNALAARGGHSPAPDPTRWPFGRVFPAETMTRINPSPLSLLVGGLPLLAVLVLAPGDLRAGEALPSVNAADLAQGRYASMRMTLQKTFININVATIDVRFDKRAQTRFAALAGGKDYSEPLAAQLAEVAL